MSLTRALAAAGVIATAGAPSLATASEPPSTSTLLYEASLGGSVVARVVLTSECPDASGVVRHSLEARSHGIVGQLRPFELRLDTASGSPAALPAKARTHVVENGRSRTYMSAFLPDSVATLPRVFGDERAITNTALERPAHDLLSWALALASGSSEEALVWDGWKLSAYTPGEGAPGVVSSKAGEIEVRSVRVERTRFDRDAPETSLLGTVHIERGAQGARALVGADVHTPLGPTRVRLVRRTTKACEGE